MKLCSSPHKPYEDSAVVDRQSMILLEICVFILQ